MPFVIQEQVVAAALSRLRERKIHTFFAGYLHLQRLSRIEGTLNGLRPDFKGFYNEFFAIAEAPPGTPYIRLFTEQKASTRNLWLNENVAGSYAPSSLRPNQPFRRVVKIENGRYTLPSNHAELAMEHLLYGQPVPVMDLAAFLYRDYALLERPANSVVLTDIFSYEFGYSATDGGPADAAFELLFRCDPTNQSLRDWVELNAH